MFLGEIARYLKAHARQIFADDSFGGPVVSTARASLNETTRETIHFFKQGKSVEEIARLRGLKESTVYGHLEEAIRSGEGIEMNLLLDAEAQREIAAAFARHGFGNLTGAVESLGGRYSHGQLRVYRASAQMRNA